MQLKMFSSLTSLRTALNARRSSECWMDIRSKLASKEGIAGLDGLLSCLLPTTTTGGRSTPLSCDDSSETESDTEEEYGISLGEEDSTDGSESEW